MSSLGILIGINGKIGSGKDSFADFAVEKYNYKKLYFAEPLKYEVKEFLLKNNLSFTDENLFGSQEDKEKEIVFDNINLICKNFFPFSDFKNKINGNKSTYRFLMQWWGTDYRRVMCDDNYWVKKFIEDSKKYDKVICSDLRFPNEYNAIVDNNGMCIKIVRDNNFKSNTHVHISETALDYITDWYDVLYNNSTLEKFYELCNDVLFEIDKAGEISSILKNWRI